MSAATARIAALATATARDLLRRPGALLAHAALAALILLIPRVASRALDDGGELALELTASTIALYLSVFGALAGATAAQPASPIGPTAELLAAPLNWGEYVLARFAGIVTSLSVVLLALVVVAAVSLIGVSDHDLVACSAAAAGIVAQVALFAALGLAVGSLTSRHLSMILVVGFVACSRLVVPGVAADAPAIVATLVPDPMRLDLARDVGFSRAVAPLSLVAACGGAALQIVGLALIATCGLRWRHARGR